MLVRFKWVAGMFSLALCLNAIGCGPNNTVKESGVDDSKVMSQEQTKSYEEQVKADMNAQSK